MAQRQIRLNASIGCRCRTFSLLHSEGFLHFLHPQILKLFYPALSAQDTFDAGQFFAVMRLVTHARDGKDISGTLAFTQGTALPTVVAQPSARIELAPHLAHPRNDSGRLPSRPTSRPQSPSKQPPPPHPSRHNGRRASYMTSVSDQNPFHRGDHRDTDHTLPPAPLVHPKPPTHPDANPLVQILLPLLSPTPLTTHSCLGQNLKGDHPVRMNLLRKFLPCRPGNLLPCNLLLYQQRLSTPFLSLRTLSNLRNPVIS
jgi:hypothetical protein